MLRLLLCVSALVLPLTSAYAAHGKVMPIPGYDYSREKKADYVRDYCEDGVGNHVTCPKGMDGNYKAQVKSR